MNDLFPLPSRPVGAVLATLGAVVVYIHPLTRPWLQIPALGCLAFLLAAVLHESGIIR